MENHYLYRLFQGIGTMRYEMQTGNRKTLADISGKKISG